MPEWHLAFTSEAEKDLKKLDRSVRNRIITKLDWLIENFDFIVHLPLTGEFKDFYKLRVGDWRVVYTIHWSSNLINVHYIDHRKNIYIKRR